MQGEGGEGGGRVREGGRRRRMQGEGGEGCREREVRKGEGGEEGGRVREGGRGRKNILVIKSVMLRSPMPLKTYGLATEGLTVPVHR